jgi:acyl-coenzyme A thioesterase PaaI-like protein
MAAIDADRIVAEFHRDCFACRPREQGGLGLCFRADHDGTVRGEFACEDEYRGYRGWIHGGIVAMLLDEAMTYCLATRGARGITARLNIRYRHPIDVGTEAVVLARMKREEPPLYEVEAEIRQRDEVRALADAKFLGE